MITAKDLLACDSATHFGWAHGGGKFGTEDLSVKKEESIGIRLVRLDLFLGKLHAELGFSVLVYESLRHRPGNQRRNGAIVVQGELQGVMKLWCETNGVHFKGYSATEIKKHATGKGTAKKEEMIDAWEKRNKKPIDDHMHDAVDAWWILDFAKKDFGID